MKKTFILLITILVVVNINAQLKTTDIKHDLFEGDKGYHFWFSSAGSLAINFFSYKFLEKRDIFNHPWQREIASGFISSLLMTGIGAGKEFIDKKNGGIFNYEDLRADMYGSFTGSALMITIRIPFSGRRK